MWGEKDSFLLEDYVLGDACTALERNKSRS